MYDLDSMILILKLDLYMITMYHLAKYEVSMSIGSKVTAQTGKQTDRQTRRHYENITSTAYAGGKTMQKKDIKK